MTRSLEATNMTMSMRRACVCVVCNERVTKIGRLLCAPCARSYDLAQEKDMTTMGLIIWAACRARQYERKAFSASVVRRS